jgi:hypothetical protein
MLWAVAAAGRLQPRRPIPAGSESDAGATPTPAGAL